MRVIYKYALAVEHGTQIVKLPAYPRILSVGFQDDALVLWAEVDPRAPVFDYRIATCFTGNALPADVYADQRFLGTVQRADGLVVHVFHLLHG